jgi:hypothetical protein
MFGQPCSNPKLRGPAHAFSITSPSTVRTLFALIQLFKNFAVDTLLGLTNGYPTELTNTRELASLIHRLHPRSPGAELRRLGPKGDGGYLVPDDLAGIEACFSPGVSTVSGFENDCAELGMQVFLADNSVDGPSIPNNRFVFTKKHVGTTSSDDYMTMDDWVSSSMPESLSDLLLQIDIEGYEYETFFSISDRLMQRFRIIVAEFHNLELFWSRPFFQLASRAFDKILQSHTCVHIHPNNFGSLRRNGRYLPRVRKHGLDIPCVMEFTFLRNDRVSTSPFTTAFPHPLDCDNSSNPSLPLPPCWYRR